MRSGGFNNINEARDPGNSSENDFIIIKPQKSRVNSVQLSKRSTANYDPVLFYGDHLLKRYIEYSLRSTYYP
jgi:hypothetical protein